MKPLQWRMDSEIGPLYLVASEKGLQGVFWKKQSAAMAESLKENAFLRQAAKQLEEYLTGTRKNFDLALDLQGTEFQKQVWQALTKIPYGETTSYQEIAKRIRNDKATRAVGTANGRNPLSLIVPCHRVIRGTGELGGYAGGLKIKTFLLELERSR